MKLSPAEHMWCYALVLARARMIPPPLSGYGVARDDAILHRIAITFAAMITTGDILSLRNVGEKGFDWITRQIDAYPWYWG